MNPERSPLVNKLTLVVLSLILACLVLLVIRAYERPPSSAQSAVATAEEPQVEEAPAAPAPETAPPPERRAMRRPPVAIPPRVVVVKSPSLESPAPEAAPAEPVEPPVVVVAPGVHLPGGSTGRSGDRAGGAAPHAESAEIFGTASLIGTPPPEIPIDFGPSCGRLRPDPVTTRHYVVNAEGRLANVLVYLSRGVPERHPSVSPMVFLDQRGCVFEPYVLGVETNQTLFIRNFDPELHNLHFLPRLNRERNIAQPSGAPPVLFTIAKPELFIRIKCDVHPWMFPYVSVFDHPYFAVTDTNGEFRLPPALPSGKYVVTATHLKAGAVSQEITVRRGEQRALEFLFAVPGPATPQSRVTTRE